MKSAIKVFPLVGIAILASCVSTSVKPIAVEPPVQASTTTSVAAAPVATPVATVITAPDWINQTLLEEGSSLYLVVTGPLNAPWPGLLSTALTKAFGAADDKFVREHSAAPARADYQKNDEGWWKYEIPKSLKEKPVDVDPSSAPEQNADTAVRTGAVLSAVDGYLTAALTALDSKRPDANQRFGTLMDKALDVVAHLTLQALPGQFTTKSGSPFAQPFQVRVIFGGNPVRGVPLRFSAKVKKNGRLALVGQTVSTDDKGVAGFAFPVPDFSAQDSVVVVLDVNAWLERLVSVPHDLQTKVGALEALSGQGRVEIPYSIDSLSKGIPLSLAYADFDEKGALIKRGDTLAGLVASLTKNGYHASTYTMNLSLLKAKEDTTVLLAWLSQGKQTGRAVFGSSTVTEVTSADKKFTATVTGTLKVYDLETRKLVHQQKAGQSATAGDRATAISLAEQQLADDFVAVLNDELP